MRPFTHLHGCSEELLLVPSLCLQCCSLGCLTLLPAATESPAGEKDSVHTRVQISKALETQPMTACRRGLSSTGPYVVSAGPACDAA